MIKSIFFASKLRNGVEESGIVRYWNTFQDINWNTELETIGEFFHFGMYWFPLNSQNRANFERLKDRGVKLIIVFPDYRNDILMDEMAKTIETEIECLRKNNTKAIDVMRHYNANIYLYPERYAFSMYKLDNRFIFVPFKQEHRNM